MVLTIHYVDIRNILQSCVIYKYVFLFCCNSWFYVHPPKTNMTKEHQPFEDVSAIGNGGCPCSHGSFRGCMFSHVILVLEQYGLRLIVLHWLSNGATNHWPNGGKEELLEVSRDIITSSSYTRGSVFGVYIYKNMIIIICNFDMM